MIRSLLNKLNTSKALRQALVLFTLLILPTAAWGQSYNLTVAGVEVTSANANEIRGDNIALGSEGKVSFNPDENTLTLEKVTINGVIVYGGTETLKLNLIDSNIEYESNAISLNNDSYQQNLTINFVGNNKIKTTSNNVFVGAKAPPSMNTTEGCSKITFDSSSTGSLTLEAGSALSSWINLINEPGILATILSPDNETVLANATKAVISVSYGLTIANVEVTSANLNTETGAITGLDNVTFTPATNILKLNNAVISGSIYTTLESLIIDITNTNSIAKSGLKNGIVSTSNTGTLTFTGTGSLEISSDCSVIRGFTAIEGLNLETKTPYEIYNDGYYRLKDKVAVDTTGVKWLKVIQETTYPLWVSNVQVTDANKGNVMNKTINEIATVVYDGNGLLQLAHTTNNENITGIYSGIGDLSIKLIGSNTIKGSGSSLITSLNSGALTFDSDGTIVSSLEFKDASENVFPDDPISGFSEVKYGTWLEYDDSFKKVCSWDIEIIKNGISYRIYDGNKDHILGEGDESVKYSHDATNGHVITLNNAEVNWIWTNIHADITIALNGTNSAINNGTNSAINTGENYAIYSNNGKINFVKAEGATSVELTATCGNGHVPIEYGSITLGEGLYWKPFYADANATVKSTVITDDPQFVIVGDRVITNGQTISGIQGSISYSESEGEKVLTLTNYVETFGSGHGNMNAIETGVTGLKVKLVGDNDISCEDNGAYAFKGTHDNASIQFVNGGSGCKLTMTTLSDPLSFGEGKVTYDGLIYYSSGGNEKYICEPTAPAMTVDTDGKIKLAKGYDDGTIYYSIAYADDTPTETDVEYSDPFALTHPATVTAWVVANGATTSTVTGKYFAYQDAPYKMAIDDSKTPVLLPAIAESDPITLSGYASTNGDIATFANGIITAKGPGTATLSVTLSAGDTQFVVLNPVPDSNAPHEYAVTFSVYVGEALGNYFEGSNEYGSFYNETAETYAVPEGMKAYVVTGINGSKLVIEETTVLPPNAVVLLEKGSATTFTKVPATGSAPTGNLLKRATSEVPVTTESSLYVLYQDQYVKVTSGTQIPTGKNYLDLSTFTNAGTRGFYDIGGANDGTSALRGVVAEGTNGKSDAWYTLQGRRLPAKPTKSGLYLHNGHKVVIK